MNYKVALTILASSAVFFVAGFFMGGLYVGNSEKGKEQACRGSFEEGWQAAQKRLEELNFTSPASDKPALRTIQGTISRVENGVIYLDTLPLEPLADPDLDERIVTVGDSAKIYALTEKSNDEYERETAEFNKAHPDNRQKINTDEYVAPPGRYREGEVDFSFFKKGQSVSVEADSDIRNEKSFKALVVRVKD